MQEALERVDRRQPLQQLLLSVRRERPPMLARFDHLPEPQALLVTPDVFDLVGDRATVGRLEIRERVRECLAWHIDAEHFGGDSRHDLRRKSQPADVEGRIAGRLAAEGIEMGGEVPEIPMRPDQRIRSRNMLQLLNPGSGAFGKRDTRNGKRGFGRLLGCSDNVSRFPFLVSRLPQALLHSLVKPLLSLQKGVEGSEKHPRLRALNDPVIVRARDRDDLRAPPGDLADGAGRDDRALALHETRDRRHGAQRAGVRQLNRATSEIVGQEPVGTRLLDKRFVRRVERREVHRLGVLDHRYDERPAAVLLLDVDR